MRAKITELRAAVEGYEDSIEGIPGNEFSTEVLALHDAVRALLYADADLDPAAVAQAVLDEHAIKPHWVRNGEQVHRLLVEAIERVTGPHTPATPIEPTPPPEDPEVLISAVYESLRVDNPLPFAEIALRHREFTQTQVRAALVILHDRQAAMLVPGFGWQRR